MTTQNDGRCLNCGRTEAQTPLVTWRYQGHKLQICPQCMPVFIHETEKVLAKWRGSSAPNPPDSAKGA